MLYGKLLEEYLGWDADPEVLEAAEFTARRNEGEFELSVGVYGHTIMDPDDFFNGLYAVGAPSNLTGWSHPAIEELAHGQQRHLDREARWKYVIEAQHVLIHEDNHIIPLFWRLTGHYAYNRIRNLHTVGAFADSLKGEHLWCDPQC